MWDIVLEGKDWQIFLAIIFAVMVPFFIRQAYKDAKEVRDNQDYQNRTRDRMKDQNWRDTFAKYIRKI